MKTRTPFTLNLMLACSAVLCMSPSPAHGQAYFFSAPPAAQVQLAVMDWSDLNAGSSRWIGVNGLADTVYYDPVGQTVRQVGTVSLDTPNDVTLSFNDAQTIDGILQTATVTVDFAVPSVLSFDSGTVTLDGGDAQFNPPSIPITGSYTILAGDQTLTGSFGYSLGFQTSFTTISDATPNSLIISEAPSYYNFSGPDIAHGVTAANGMVFNLVGGISDGTYSSSWSLNPVTANAETNTVVPEPGSLLLFGLGLLVCGLGTFRYRTRLQRVRVVNARRQRAWGQCRGH